jgi:hypothetical protein
MPEPVMELCLLHANCQGEPLLRLLAASPGFAARWRVRLYTNYTREPIPARDLENCRLFLYQHLGPEWGGLASERLLERLPPGAAALCLPNPFFKGYWPLWTNASTMNFGDVYLDLLVDKGLSPAEAVHLYLRDSLTGFYDLDALVAESQALERRREQNALIPLADYVEERWRDEQLFTTVNHPGSHLLRRIADAVLKALGLPPLSPAASAGLDLACDPHFELPIHPVAGRHFRLPFAGEERRYPVYGNRLNFREYALCYADCRRRGLNFLEYLQSVRL